MEPVAPTPPFISTVELSEGAFVCYKADLLSTEEAASLFSRLRERIPWKNLNDSFVVQPRLVSWHADNASHTYSYAATSLSPVPFTDDLKEMRDRISALDAALGGTLLSGTKLNTVLLNLYRDGNDFVRWHADNEPCFGVNPVIVSISLGATRVFAMKPITRTAGSDAPNTTPAAASGPSTSPTTSNAEAKRVDFKLTSGSLLVMKGTTQERWLHSVPKDAKVTEPRINLTFRYYS